MSIESIEKLKYPIGQFNMPERIENREIENWIADIKEFPILLSQELGNLDNQQLNWHYRPGGWSIKQVVHHCADSHMNAYIRFKLALTEENPTIKPYFEDRWAQLPDATDNDPEYSLAILYGLHGRWVKMLTELKANDLKRSFIHPEHGTGFTLEETIGNYAWHCRHHLAHIQQAIVHRGDF